MARTMASPKPRQAHWSWQRLSLRTPLASKFRRTQASATVLEARRAAWRGQRPHRIKPKESASPIFSMPKPQQIHKEADHCKGEDVDGQPPPSKTSAAKVTTHPPRCMQPPSQNDKTPVAAALDIHPAELRRGRCQEPPLPAASKETASSDRAMHAVMAVLTSMECTWARPLKPAKKGEPSGCA